MWKELLENRLGKPGQRPFPTVAGEPVESRCFKPERCYLSAAGLSGTAVLDSAGYACSPDGNGPSGVCVPGPGDLGQGETVLDEDPLPDASATVTPVVATAPLPVQ